MLYEARLKYLRDQLSNIRGERKAGRQEGIKEGMAILIQNMAEKGMDIPEIARVTGFSKEEVQEMTAEQ